VRPWFIARCLESKVQRGAVDWMEGVSINRFYCIAATVVSFKVHFARSDSDSAVAE
jgi:hypothetical protein